MDSIYNHVVYMEAIATNLKEIEHSNSHKAFAVASTISLFEGLSENINDINMPALVVIDDLASRLAYNNSDNTVEVPFYQFVIVCTADVNDASEQNNARRKAKALAKKVLSRMFKDERSYDKGLNYLDRNSISFDPVGPVADGAYGCMVTFTLTEPAGIVYTANDWIDG